MLVLFDELTREAHRHVDRLQVVAHLVHLLVELRRAEQVDPVGVHARRSRGLPRQRRRERHQAAARVVPLEREVGEQTVVVFQVEEYRLGVGEPRVLRLVGDPQRVCEQAACGADGLGGPLQHVVGPGAVESLHARRRRPEAAPRRHATAVLRRLDDVPREVVVLLSAHQRLEGDRLAHGPRDELRVEVAYRDGEHVEVLFTQQLAALRSDQQPTVEMSAQPGAHVVQVEHGRRAAAVRLAVPPPAGQLAGQLARVELHPVEGLQRDGGVRHDGRVTQQQRPDEAHLKRRRVVEPVEGVATELFAERGEHIGQEAGGADRHDSHVVVAPEVALAPHAGDLVAGLVHQRRHVRHAVVRHPVGEQQDRVVEETTETRCGYADC